MKQQSVLMRLFRWFGFDGLAWSLRRFHCPVPPGALVLELGSGARPYYRSNVLCDAFMTNQQRSGLSLVADRPLVLGFAEKLPFKDGAFDYLICSYMFEHTTDPEAFLSEMQRVAHEGFFEVPLALRERFTNVPIHTLEIHEDQGMLYITKKNGRVHDPELKRIVKPETLRLFDECMLQNPFSFQLRHHWSRETGGIRYEITNPDYEFDWEAPTEEHVDYSPSLFGRAKLKILDLYRRLRSPRVQVDVASLLRCVECGGAELESSSDTLTCSQCGSSYEIHDGGIPDFTQSRRA